MSVQVIILLAMAPLGVIFVLVGLVIAARRRVFLSRGVRVPGVVVTLESLRSADTNRTTSYVPVVSFTALTGQQLTVRPYGIFPSNPPGFRPGQPVPIVYDPANPNKATIASFSSNEWMSLILAGCGAFIIVLGVALAFLI